jgi:site-specific recombinase XerD
MRSCPRWSSSHVTRDGRDQRGRALIDVQPVAPCTRRPTRGERRRRLTRASWQMTTSPDTALRLFKPPDIHVGDPDAVDDVDADDVPAVDFVAVASRALARFNDIADKAQDFARHAKAANTLKAYRNDWDDFLSWCGLHRLEPLPAAAQTIALYLTDLSKTHKVSTLYRRLSGISQAHQAAGHQPPPTWDPQVRLVFQGIRRTLGAAPDQKNPAITAEVRAMLETLDVNTLSGVRDRALLLVGPAGAFRRSELVSLDVGDVSFTADGLFVQLRRSKTDQEAVGRKVGLPFGSNPLTRPVRALRDWLSQSDIVQGPIFRPIDRHGNIDPRRLTDQSAALIVKRCAKDADLDPEKYAGHSLRSGLATAAAMADVSERMIMAQTGHKSLPVVRRYIRDGSLFRRNAAAAVGLQVGHAASPFNRPGYAAALCRSYMLAQDSTCDGRPPMARGRAGSVAIDSDQADLYFRRHSESANREEVLGCVDRRSARISMTSAPRRASTLAPRLVVGMVLVATVAVLAGGVSSANAQDGEIAYIASDFRGVHVVQADGGGDRQLLTACSCSSRPADRRVSYAALRAHTDRSHSFRMANDSRQSATRVMDYTAAVQHSPST